MKQNKLNPTHKKYDSKFEYKGTHFIVDHLPKKDSWHKKEWLVTEHNFMVQGFADDLEEAKEMARLEWDIFKS